MHSDNENNYNIEVNNSVNTVKLEFFEGPLDLLLSLIKKKKINIYDIPIKEITEDYLNAIGLNENQLNNNSFNMGKYINIDIGGDFIVMAAHLIYLKSLMLLPKSITQDESPSDSGIDGDPRNELAYMLIEYQKVKEIASFLDNKPILGRDVFNININNNRIDNIIEKNDSLLFEANIYALSKAFYYIAKEAKSRIDFYELKKIKFSIKEKIIEIVNMLQDSKAIKFSELISTYCNSHNSKELFIIYFLSILEMSRLTIIKIYQEEDFGEIYISLFNEDELLNYKLKIENIN
ncbi:MAG: segregation/condensation protein A [Deltaproteobacteria bacterium]|nr:segregation/condensation protein A [Deltaproteobacteria bacterium]